MCLIKRLEQHFASIKHSVDRGIKGDYPGLLFFCRNCDKLKGWEAFLLFYNLGKMGHKKGNYALDTIVFVLIDLDEFTLKYKTQLAHGGF